MAEHGQSFDFDEHDEDELSENSQSEHNQGHEDDRVTVDSEKRWPGWPGYSVFRMLVPAQKVGSIIGRKGESIKKLCEETRARIIILDGPLGTAEHAVVISAREEPGASLPPAIDGLLRVHRRIVDGLDGDSSHAPLGARGVVSTVLLIATSQAGSLIGKQGATVKSIQEASSCIVRVIDEDPPSFAFEDDRIVEVVGEPAGVHKAIELIASHVRKFLVDRSVIPLFEMQMEHMPYPQMEQMHSPESWGPSPLGEGPGYGYGYGTNPHYVSPARQVDHYYSPVGMQLPHQKQPHRGISAYGREAPININASRPAHSMITQVTQKMQIPVSYADAVIGTCGASISYTRRASGATVTIQETMGVPGEMTVEINGTVLQVQTAQQLIQHFTETAGPVENQTGAATDQDYNPYAAAQGSIFASPPYSSAWKTGRNGGYDAVYGGNYGY